ncbi:hypothetical protein [Pseudoalteromonas rubra]|uniref:hypothetical protein n=1 Tax=Pseudoalteromonas rubra TaxID=43658 RepID=UPI000F7B316C|nr:hypothetical protein [Pseudoalteromonas rubra]
MKNAVIVVGSHYVGKSKTINLYVKPKLGLSQRAHKFERNGLHGFILSQSFEEAERDVDYVLEQYGQYDLLVLACRPANETPSDLIEATKKLKKAGFDVYTVSIRHHDNEEYYDGKANEVLASLDEK